MARNRSRSPLRGAGHRPPALQEAAVDRRRPSVASPASTDPSRRRRRNEIAKKKQTNTAHTFARLLPEFSVSFRSRNSRPHRASQVSGHRERFYDRKLSLAPAWQKKRNETQLSLIQLSRIRYFDRLASARRWQRIVIQNEARKTERHRQKCLNTVPGRYLSLDLNQNSFCITFKSPALKKNHPARCQ